MPPSLPYEGGVPVSSPLEPHVERMRLSPEELVQASLPWEGMDGPADDPAAGCVRVRTFVTRCLTRRHAGASCAAFLWAARTG